MELKMRNVKEVFVAIRTVERRLLIQSAPVNFPWDGTQDMYNNETALMISDIDKDDLS